MKKSSAQEQWNITFNNAIAIMKHEGFFFSKFELKEIKKAFVPNIFIEKSTK